jgi:hypothetical protein
MITTKFYIIILEDLVLETIVMLKHGKYVIDLIKLKI